MQTLDAVLQAPSGAVYAQFAKRYNQVLMPIHRASLDTSSLVNSRNNNLEILWRRSPSTIPTGTVRMLETTGLGNPNSKSPLMIQNLGILRSGNMKFRCSIISVNPSLQITRSTGPIVSPSLGDPWSSLGDPCGTTSIGDPCSIISMNSYLDFLSSRIPALAPSQRSLRNTSMGTPSSSVVGMPEAPTQAFEAAYKSSTCKVTLSSTIPKTATPLILGCSASLNISNLANIRPGYYICPFGRDMILLTVLCQDFTGIEPGEYSQTFIEGLLQLSLLSNSFPISPQMILKPPSFLVPEAAGAGRVTGYGKHTAMEMFTPDLMLSCCNRDRYVSYFPFCSETSSDSYVGAE
jgi:hypothetical protein